MRHAKAGRQLRRTGEQKLALMRGLAMSLLAAGSYVSAPRLAAGITWAAVTAVPESFSVPVAGSVATVMLASAVPSGSV